MKSQGASEVQLRRLIQICVWNTSQTSGLKGQGLNIAFSEILISTGIYSTWFGLCCPSFAGVYYVRVT